MKRHLISQMQNEWRSNLWLVIELTVISMILWFIFCFLLSFASTRLSYAGYDLTDVYAADLRGIHESSPVYQPYDSLHSYYTDRDLLLAGLRENPYVELLGTGNNALPYNYNYSGAMLQTTEADSAVEYSGNCRWMSPETVRIIRLEGIGGETSDQLASVIEKGDLIISTFDEEAMSKSHHPSYFQGKTMSISSDSSKLYRVGAVSYGIKRSDYEPLLWAGTIILPQPSNEWANQVIFRVKEGMGDKFVASLSAKDMQAGNVYITGLKSIDQMRDIAHIEINNMILSMSVCCSFLLVVIFLSFFGTFWFRTQERVGEIAIRKVNGATRHNIFMRFISEGLLLLVPATVIAGCVEYLLIDYQIIEIADMLGQGNIYFLSSATTAIVMAMLIVAGIWLPASKAMNVNTAYALKDQ